MAQNLNGESLGIPRDSAYIAEALARLLAEVESQFCCPPYDGPPDVSTAWCAMWSRLLHGQTLTEIRGALPVWMWIAMVRRSKIEARANEILSEMLASASPHLSHSDCPPAGEEPGAADRQTSGAGITTPGAAQSEAQA